MADSNSWDDWNDLEPANPVTVANLDDDDEPIDPKPVDDDEIPFAERQTLNPLDDDNDDDPADPKDNERNVDISGIELYLAQFDIEGGMIAFEDGTATHFNDLAPDKQAEVLQQLHETNTPAIEDVYGLDDTEIGMINYLRANNLTVEQLIDTMAEERVNTILARNTSASVDYDTMPDDSVYLKFLSKSDPDATTEQLEDNLRIAKSASNYEKLTASLREQYKTEQLTEARSANDMERRAQLDELDDQRRLVVETVKGITDVAGVSVNDDVKNSILDRVLEVNDDGDSIFLGEVFSDPTKLFQAAFWYYYGEDLSRQRDEYWKKEKSMAYKRGRQDALGTSGSDSKRSFTSKQDNPTPGRRNTANETEDDWESLHTN